MSRILSRLVGSFTAVCGMCLLAMSTASAGPIQLIVESDTDGAAGLEVFTAGFANFDEFISSPPGPPSIASGINIADGFDIVGFAYDGMYRLLVESNTDSGAGTEVFAASFASFDDFINSPPGPPSVASGLNIAEGFDIVGFTYDGMYRLLVESNTDALAGSEVFAASFASFDDFINSPPGAPSAASGINIAQGFSIVGAVSPFEMGMEPPTGIPEPPAWTLLALAFLASALRRRSCRHG